MKINFKRSPLAGIIREISIASNCPYYTAYRTITRFCDDKPSQINELRVLGAFKTSLLERRSTPANRKIIDKILRKYFPDFDLSQGGEK